MRRAVSSLVLFAVCAGGALAGETFFATSALATVREGPGLSIESEAVPTMFSPAHRGTATSDTYMLTVTNVGGLATDGSPVTIRDTLPPALTLRGLSGALQSSDGQVQLACTQATASCTYEGVLQPGDSLLMLVTVAVVEGAVGPVTNTAAVSGGGATTQTTSESTPVGSEAEALAVPYGLSNFAFHVNDRNGLTAEQVDSHPYENTISYTLNSIPDSAEKRYAVAGGLNGGDGASKDFVFTLPPGFLGNPDVVAKCPQYDIPAEVCPPATQIGVVKFKYGPIPSERFGHIVIARLYNVIPDAGFPAEFEFRVLNNPVALYATVTPETNYGVRVTVPDIPQVGAIQSVATTFFGTPGADKNYLDENSRSASGLVQPAFLENPSECTTQPQTAEMYVDSWQRPGALLADGVPNIRDVNWGALTSTVFPQLTGCDLLQFNPSLEVTPDTTQADEPTGLTVNLRIRQAPFFENELGTPALRTATVTLPSGVSVSPSAADGLEGCSLEQIDLSSALPGHCPMGARVGTASVATPLLSVPLEGAVYLERPRCNPCSSADASDGNMFRLLLEVSGAGVVVKKEGVVYANPSTGQLTTTFSDLPEEPVNAIRLRFNGGLRAPLATPQSCGPFESTSDFTPFSTPVTADGTPSSGFNVSWDGGGGSCPATSPFAPTFEAGTTNPNAGQLSPLIVSFHREDREQDLAGIQVTMPPGLLGSLDGIPLCEEPQADLGTCSVASRIGGMTVAAGPGGHPFYERGEVYLTGPYRGAPFGLSIVVPTIAGPFNLGNVVVRATVRIDQHTAALMVTTDPLPQVIDGVLLRLRLANVTIDRPHFIFNPSNCALQHIQATMTGARGGVAHMSVPFAVSGCAGLPFAPKFSVSTTGRTSRANGASLDARLTLPMGAQSNIAMVKVDLPRQLPARLSTLQTACTDSVFNANPAACPAGSLIGMVSVRTPVLPLEPFGGDCRQGKRCPKVAPASLVGPVYFVSHGGARFPDVVAVLEGYGVRVDLVGATFISKGFTSSTFEGVPDVPVSSFELFLPQGAHSALSANGNLCRTKLTMPTLFVAQDGAQLKQNTPVKVTGCSASKRKRAAKRAVLAHRKVGESRGGR